MNDLHFSIRQLLKNPGFTCVGVLTLALGIGVNSALFSIMYASLFAPLPYPKPDRLVQVQTTISSAGKAPQSFPYWSYPRFELLRNDNRIFTEIAAIHKNTVIVSGKESAERVEAELVSANYFPLLGVHATHGRVFVPQEDQKGDSQPVVVISDRYWQRYFGGDPGVLGGTLKVNGTLLTVVGVLPPGFKGQSGATEMWMPITLVPALVGDPSRLARPFTMWHSVLARLHPSTSLAAARASLDSLEHQLESTLPVSSEKETYGIALLPFKEATTDPFIRQSLWVLAAAVGFVLLIACANTANLQLVRAISRRREFAVRLALGASRVRLTRQLLAESLVLATVAGLLALFFARWVVDIMSALQPTDEFTHFAEYASLPNLAAIHLGTPILAFNFVIALVCGLVFGLAPAWRVTIGDLTPALHRLSERPTGANRGLGLRGGRGLLVVAETALALVLLAGAGLMVHSYARLSATPLGFDRKNLLTFRLDQPGDDSPQKATLFFSEMLKRLHALPGVESVCLANATPLSSSFDRSSMVVRSTGKDSEPVEASVGIHLASPEYLHTLRIPLVKGRWLADDDRQGTPLVAVINETAARKYWPGIDPVGQQVDLRPALGPESGLAQVVGVVRDVKYDQVATEIGPDVYLSYRQSFYPGYFFILRTARDPQALARAVRSAVAEENPNLPIYDLLTMDQRIANSTSRSRFNTLLLLMFSGLAVLLAAVGLYGVVACSVAQRTREIGIRIALGARESDVLRLILKQGIRLVLVGAAIGLAGALALTRLLRSFLFGVTPTDPLTFASIILLLSAIALLACWLPARRALKVDPIEVLRNE
jgi:predicted permease